MMLRAIALLALCLGMLASPARAADDTAPKGNLVIIGGALRADNAPVWERIVALAGGKGARIAVFPTAAGNPEKSGNNMLAVFRRYGADPFIVSVAPHGVAAPALAADVASAGAAYFVGGEQSRITRALRRADGSNSAVLDALWTLYRRGGTIAGTSAGAAVMSATMFNDPPPILDMLTSGMVEGRDVAPGLGFIGPDVFVDQHLLVRGRFARMIPVMLKKGVRIGLGIDENTAMIIGPQRDVEVLGYRGMILLDLGQATSAPGAFNVSNARISYLDSGDRYQLDSGVLTPSADKAGGKVDPAQAAHRGELFYADVLGNTTVVNMMEKLIDSQESTAIGLAYGGPRSAAPASGFEFKLSKAADSIGYESASSQAYTVYRLRLDVKPVRISQPLYRDLP